MSTIKVLHLVSPGIGGIENYIFSHYKYMNRSRFQFDFLTQNQKLKGAEEFREFDYEVKLLSATAAKDRALFVRQVRKVLMGGYDVLHLHTCYWTGFLIEEIAKEVGIRKVIVHSHSTFIDETNAVKRNQLLRQHEAIKNAFTQDLATDFWACSWDAADWLFGEQIPKSKIKIMKNAIELDRFQFNKQTRERIRADLGLDDDTLVLGTTGRLTYSKNHAFLIEMFSVFHQKHPKSKLIIIGDGELLPDLERQICDRRLENHVLLLGWKNDVENYLQAMDVFLLPSRFEGFPIVIVEAAASGLPCIASDQIPEDVFFTERIRRIPLDMPVWNQTLEEAAVLCTDRQEGIRIVQAAGYDVRQQARELEKMYES